MPLEALGWNSWWAEKLAVGALADGEPGRVTSTQRGQLRVLTARGETTARLRGRDRTRRTVSPPVVGDWVTLAPEQQGGARLVIGRLPRRTAILRKQAGRALEAQVLAANVDLVFVVAACTRDFNPRRLERYLAMAWESGAEPVVVLSKADLASAAETQALLTAKAAVAGAVRSIVASQIDGRGLAEIGRLLAPSLTGVFVGSSGVGKSTLVNAIAAGAAQRVAATRESDDRGRHTTTAREMFFLAEGGAIIDTPGLRELQLWSGEGLERTFGEVAALAEQCRFRDCRHRGEPGCAVEAAVVAGNLSPERLTGLRKLAAELDYLAAGEDPRARRARKEWARRACREQRRMERRDPRR